MTIKENNTAVKKWLWRYREAKIEAWRMKEEYFELLSVQESIKAVRYDSQPGGTTKQDLSDMIVARERMERMVERANSEILRVYGQISKAISMLEYQTEKNVISARYIQLKNEYDIRSMEEIGKQLHYSERYVQKIHGLALINLEPIIREIEASDR